LPRDQQVFLALAHDLIDQRHRAAHRAVQLGANIVAVVDEAAVWGGRDDADPSCVRLDGEAVMEPPGAIRLRADTDSLTFICTAIS
jgi:hypothetical protein